MEKASHMLNNYYDFFLYILLKASFPKSRQFE